MAHSIKDRNDVIIELNRIFKGMEKPLLMECLAMVREKCPEFWNEEWGCSPETRAVKSTPLDDGGCEELPIPETLDISGKDTSQLYYCFNPVTEGELAFVCQKIRQAGLKRNHLWWLLSFLEHSLFSPDNEFCAFPMLVNGRGLCNLQKIRAHLDIVEDSLCSMDGMEGDYDRLAKETPGILQKQVHKACNMLIEVFEGYDSQKPYRREGA